MSNGKESSYLDMSIPEIVKALCDHAQPGPQRHEEIKGALNAKLTKSLTDSIDCHEKAASRLAQQLLWLNIIFGTFTVIGTLFAIISFLK